MVRDLMGTPAGGGGEGKALEETRWPGRCQRVERGGRTFLLDGAHTGKSMEVCMEWFKKETGKEGQGGRR